MKNYVIGVQNSSPKFDINDIGYTMMLDELEQGFILIRTNDRERGIFGHSENIGLGCIIKCIEGDTYYGVSANANLCSTLVKEDAVIAIFIAMINELLFSSQLTAAELAMIRNRQFIDAMNKFATETYKYIRSKVYNYTNV